MGYNIDMWYFMLAYQWWPCLFQLGIPLGPGGGFGELPSGLGGTPLGIWGTFQLGALGLHHLHHLHHASIRVSLVVLAQLEAWGICRWGVLSLCLCAIDVCM